MASQAVPHSQTRQLCTSGLPFFRDCLAFVHSLLFQFCFSFFSTVAFVLLAKILLASSSFKLSEECFLVDILSLAEAKQKQWSYCTRHGIMYKPSEVLKLGWIRDFLSLRKIKNQCLHTQSSLVPYNFTSCYLREAYQILKTQDKTVICLDKITHYPQRDTCKTKGYLSV